MKQLILTHQINKFYHIFGEVLGYKITIKVSTLKDKDFLSQVLYDISEALEGYDYDETDEMFVWLTKLFRKVATLYDTPQRNYAVVVASVLIIAALVGGYTIGRHNTIRQAELIDITDTEYLIDFGGEVHEYEYSLDVVDIQHTDNGILYIFEDGTGYYTQNLVSIKQNTEGMEERTQSLVLIKEVE